MKHYTLLIFLIVFGLTSCQIGESTKSEESVGTVEEEEEYEEGGRTEGNRNKAEPVPAHYINNVQCDNVAETITYTNHIKEIVDTRCAVTACHNSISKENGIDMTGYANTRRVFEHGKGLCSVTHDFEANCRHMPTSQIKLSDRNVNQILCWAKTGFKE